MELTGSDSRPPASLEQTALNGAQRALSGHQHYAAALQRGEITAANMVGLKQQFLMYTLNLKLIGMADEMKGQLLDMLA